MALAIKYVAYRNYQLKQKEKLKNEIASLIDERDYLLETIKDIRATISDDSGITIKYYVYA